MKIFQRLLFCFLISFLTHVQALPDTNRLMTWAEIAFSNLFQPRNQATRALTIQDPLDPFFGEWEYRFYPITDSYIAIKSTGDVLILNKTLRPEPFVVGQLATLIRRVPANIEAIIPEIGDTQLKSCVDVDIPKSNYVAAYKTVGDIRDFMTLNNAPDLIPSSSDEGLLTIEWLNSAQTAQQYQLKFISSEQTISQWVVDAHFETIDQFRYRTDLIESSRVTENTALYSPSLKAAPILTYCDQQQWSTGEVTATISNLTEAFNQTTLISSNTQVNAINEVLTLNDLTYTTVKMTTIDQNQQKTIRWLDIKSGVDAKREIYNAENQLIFAMRRRD